MLKDNSIQPINVTCVEYDDTNEFFTVLFDGRTGKIRKADMSIYPLKIDKQIDALIGKDMRAVVLEDDGNNIWLSRKPIMEERLNELAQEPIGKVLKVTITSASDVALYCDLGDGISGIIYKNDIITAPFSYPSDIYPVGSVIDAKVKCYKKEKAFFTLSHKDVFPKDKSSYYKGMHLNGVIRSPILKRGEITGYFVEITPAISGILDVNDSIHMDNGEKIPMVVNDITTKGLKLRLEYPN